MASSADITVLNTLIATTLDSMKGYNEACEDDDGRYRDMFTDMARDRSETASKLQAQVRQLGGDPEEHSSTLGAAHRVFLNLKQAVTGSDEESLIKEVERGEDYLKNKYEEALKTDSLEPATRSVIEEAYASVRRGHDRVSAIKHAMTSTS
jgi:uncharacterized protein (TIGR02284 family)